MKQAIIFLVVAVMGITTVAAQSTAPVYVIDGEKVANFNGSQLVGKMVDYYHIDSVITTSKSIPEERNGLVLRSSKSNYSIPDISNAERFSPAEAIFVKDGKLIEPFEFVRLSSSVIMNGTIPFARHSLNISCFNILNITTFNWNIIHINIFYTLSIFLLC